MTLFTDDQSLYFVFFVMFSSWRVWFLMLLSIVLALTPDILLRVLENIRRDYKFVELERASTIMSKNSYSMSPIPSRIDFSRTEMSELTAVEVVDPFGYLSTPNSTAINRAKLSPNMAKQSRQNSFYNLNSLNARISSMRASNRSTAKSNQIAPNDVRF